MFWWNFLSRFSEIAAVLCFDIVFECLNCYWSNGVNIVFCIALETTSISVSKMFTAFVVCDIAKLKVNIVFINSTNFKQHNSLKTVSTYYLLWLERLFDYFRRSGRIRTRLSASCLRGIKSLIWLHTSMRTLRTFPTKASSIL